LGIYRLIVSIQTELAYMFGGYFWVRGSEIVCPRAQDTLAILLVRSTEECPFIQNANANAAWRHSRRNGLNRTN